VIDAITTIEFVRKRQWYSYRISINLKVKSLGQVMLYASTEHSSCILGNDSESGLQGVTFFFGASSKYRSLD